MDEESAWRERLIQVIEVNESSKHVQSVNEQQQQQQQQTN